MNSRLHGKRCLVTAAAQGIGRETALAFAREGATVIATDVNEAALERLAADDSAVQAHVLDVTETAAIEALVLPVGTVDVLFNCAGYVHQGSILQCTDADWRRSFQEVAALALYLASDESLFTTGQIHIIDGGWSN
jgi:2-keto-3-deoxy-L-fuconate dehydrogenase